jgi:hypothetical protein
MIFFADSVVKNDLSIKWVINIEQNFRINNDVQFKIIVKNDFICNNQLKERDFS